MPDLPLSPEQVRADILRNGLGSVLAQTFLGTLAAGAAGRGLYGVIREVNQSPMPASALARQFPVAIPEEPEEKKQRGLLPAPKLAEAIGAVPKPPQLPAVPRPGAMSMLGAPKPPAVPKLPLVPGGSKVAHDKQALDPLGAAGGAVYDFVGDTLGGLKSESLADYPWTMAGTALAAGAGLGGGWKMTDMLLERRRRNQQAAQLEAAKNEYETALLPAGSKAASALGQDLDAVYEALTKSGLDKQADDDSLWSRLGSWLPTPTNVALGGAVLSNPGRAANIGLGVGIPLAVLSTLGTYKAVRNMQDQRQILERASRERSRRLLTGAPVYAYPQSPGDEPDA